jgi:hypothetical protein
VIDIRVPAFPEVGEIVMLAVTVKASGIVTWLRVPTMLIVASPPGTVGTAKVTLPEPLEFETKEAIEVPEVAFQ